MRATLPFSSLCSVNDRLAPRPGKKKGLTVSPQWRDRMATAHYQLLQQRPKGVRPCTIKLWRVDFHIWMPDDTRQRNADNYLKLCLDALQGVLYVDDFQVKKISMEDMGVSKEPHLFLRAQVIRR